MARHFGAGRACRHRCAGPRRLPGRTTAIVNRRSQSSSAFLIACLAGAACAPGIDATRSASMPHPAGCFVLVYDEPAFMGAREYLNGPARHATLTVLPFRVEWRRRIRSAQVGPSARATLWADEGFSGAVLTLGANSAYPGLGETFSGEVESLEIACLTGPPATGTASSGNRHPSRGAS